MILPKIQPIAIPTKGLSYWKRVWVWWTCVRKWQLIEDWYFYIPDTPYKFIIPKGFVFDGASIPRFLWVLLAPTGILFIPALVHDFAYQYNYLLYQDDGSE